MSELEPTRTYSNPTATEGLRRLLDERGVEYEGGERSLRWRDRYGVMIQAFPLANGELGMGVWSCTPEQAIAATLGSCNRSSNCTNGERTETCHDEGTFNSWGLFTCSNCSIVFPLDAVKDAPSIGRVIPPKYRPNCGAKVVEPTTNDVGAEVDE